MLSEIPPLWVLFWEFLWNTITGVKARSWMCCHKQNPTSANPEMASLPNKDTRCRLLCYFQCDTLHGLSQNTPGYENSSEMMTGKGFAETLNAFPNKISPTIIIWSVQFAKLNQSESLSLFSGTFYGLKTGVLVCFCSVDSNCKYAYVNAPAVISL